MPTREVVIAAPDGLHARPAAAFVQAAKGTGVAVTIQKGDSKAVSTTSILQVLALGARTGDTVILAAEGEGAEEAIATLAARLEDPNA